MKITSVGDKCSMRTDRNRHNEANNRFSQFCERAQKHYSASNFENVPAVSAASRISRFVNNMCSLPADIRTLFRTSFPSYGRLNVILTRDNTYPQCTVISRNYSGRLSGRHTVEQTRTQNFSLDQRWADPQAICNLCLITNSVFKHMP